MLAVVVEVAMVVVPLTHLVALVALAVVGQAEVMVELLAQLILAAAVVVVALGILYSRLVALVAQE
jgi:hypothetical protein